MDLNIASGGPFDVPTEIIEDNGGAITLDFDDCPPGIVESDIPSIGRS